MLISKRKLQHYFESHPVIVVTLFPLVEVVRNPDSTEEIMNCALELMGQGISFAARMTIKT